MTRLKPLDSQYFSWKNLIVNILKAISLFRTRILKKTLRLRSFYSLILLIILVDSKTSLARLLLSKLKRILNHGKVVRCQQGNTSTLGINATIIKKDQIVEKDLSQVICYKCYNKSYYTNRYPDKQS